MNSRKCLVSAATRRSANLAALFLLAGAASWAQAPATDTTTIRVVCTITSSLDETPGLDKTSGEDLLTVVYRPDGVATIRRDGLGATFAGRVTDEEIVGEVTYDIGLMRVREKITVNRFTTEYVRTLDSDRGGLVFFGKCTRVTQPLI